MKRVVLAGAMAALASPLCAQTQQVKPPIAVYWLSAETHAGMGMPMAPGMGGVLPAALQGGKRLKLDLGSTQSAGGTPRATHAVPSALSMGASLPLLTPDAERAQSPRTAGNDEPFERPKGRMLIYWGCGDAIRTGQPVVVDFANMGAQDAAKAFRSRSVARPSAPVFGRNRTYGEWPNRESSIAVPQQASLIGDHAVSGNYSPDIRFAVSEGHDFLAPIAFEPVRKAPSGAFQVKWQAIPAAIGYMATAVGQGENPNDVVMWSSSDVQEMGHALMDYLPPVEVQRLIRDKVVMSPQTTECAVPAGIFKNEGAMLNFIAYGDELNVVYPPRPSDPKKVWEQQYAVKLRLKSTGMTMLAENGSAAHGPARRSSANQVEEGGAASPAVRAPAAVDAVQQGIGVLRGIFGR
jgi:hypothetical protein